MVENRGLTYVESFRTGEGYGSKADGSGILGSVVGAPTPLIAVDHLIDGIAESHALSYGESIKAGEGDRSKLADPEITAPHVATSRPSITVDRHIDGAADINFTNGSVTRITSGHWDDATPWATGPTF